MKWTYGVTTVPQRLGDLLPTTLTSLQAAGFDQPRLFVDGEADPTRYNHFNLPVTLRNPIIRTFGNWILALWELYIREPNSERYAVFQDDFVTYRNLKEYLSRTAYPEKGYLNLYTFPSNQQLAPETTGWYLSNQMGRGAVALVFSRTAVVTLLQQPDVAARPQDSNRGHKAVDGCVVTVMKKVGWKEYVHNPSLVQHTGTLSTMKNAKHPLATSFRGEDFDALELLEEQPTNG